MKNKSTYSLFSELCKVIAIHLGLHFPEERWNMLSRNLILAAGEFGFEHQDEFIPWLISTNLNKKQLEILAKYLTISETFFWREQHVFSAITDSVIPELIASKRNREKSIRIWSAGCSSGEEPYSLAIAIHKTIPNIKDWKITILATDINPKSLSKAVTGIYTKWSFRNCPSWLRYNYFHDLGEGNYKIIPEIRDMVTFANLNLTEDIFPSQINTNAMDIIFCRNVLMYFTEEWVNKISENFFHSLNEDGWFVVSSCELSSNVFPNFIPVNYPGAILYHKRHKDLLTSIKPYSHVLVPDNNFNLTTNQSFFEEPVLNSTINDSDTSVYPTIPVKVPENDFTVIPIAESEVIQDKVPVTIYVSEIRLLANKGCLQEALNLCNEGIAGDKLSIGLYSLRASILQELNKHCEAIASLKQAIYLDPNFIIGHFALGNLFIREGKTKNAKMHFKNVINLIGAFVDEDIIPESDGLSVKYIKDIIMANMEKLKKV